MVEQYNRELPYEQVFSMLKRDLEKLKLDAQRPTPTWTSEERARLERALLDHQDLATKEYQKANRWWKKIAWGPMIVWNLFVAAIWNIF